MAPGPPRALFEHDRGRRAHVPSVRAWLAFGALRELLARIADTRALVLHIDDLQWGDLDTAALLREILRPPDAPPMLLVLGYRSEERERSPCLRALAAAHVGDLARLELGPLQGAAAEALAAALLGTEQRDTDLARIVNEAGGSPFFIQELARFARHAPHGTAAGPPDLVSALRAHVEQLPAPARQLLDVVAVAGHPIAEDLVRRAARLDGAAWDAWRLLEHARLVRFGGPRDTRVVEAYHDRIREVVLAALPAARRVACHAGLASAQEARGGADPEVLAHHHEAAGAMDGPGISRPSPRDRPRSRWRSTAPRACSRGR